jgi:hypothetical protein
MCLQVVRGHQYLARKPLHLRTTSWEIDEGRVNRNIKHEIKPTTIKSTKVMQKYLDLFIVET